MIYLLITFVAYCPSPFGVSAHWRTLLFTGESHSLGHGHITDTLYDFQLSKKVLLQTSLLSFSKMLDILISSSLSEPFLSVLVLFFY